MGAKLKARGGGVERLNKLRASVRGWRVKVGVLGTGQGAPPGELTMPELAAIHEFGAPRAAIPERSFLRATADAKRREWLALLERGLRAALAERLTVEQAFGLTAQRAVADIVARIRSGAGIPPPLQPATVRRKGSTRPLVDTGRLVQSISYSIKRSP
jgi:hypothetical protein